MQTTTSRPSSCWWGQRRARAAWRLPPRGGVRRLWFAHRERNGGRGAVLGLERGIASNPVRCKFTLRWHTRVISLNSYFPVFGEHRFSDSSTPRNLHCAHRWLLSPIAGIWTVWLHSSRGVEDLRRGRTPEHALNVHNSNLDYKHRLQCTKVV